MLVPCYIIYYTLHLTNVYFFFSTCLPYYSNHMDWWLILQINGVCLSPTNHKHKRPYPLDLKRTKSQGTRKMQKAFSISSASLEENDFCGGAIFFVAVLACFSLFVCLVSFLDVCLLQLRWLYNVLRNGCGDVGLYRLSMSCHWFYVVKIHSMSI